MKSKLIQLLLALSLVFVPITAVHADAVTDGLNKIRGPFPQNALGGNADNIVLRVIEILLYLAAILAVIFLIWGGYLYITSGGNEETVAKGKKAIIYALIGLVVVILSWLIVSTVTRLVTTGNIGSGGSSNSGGNGNGNGNGNSGGGPNGPPGPPGNG